MLRIFYLLNLWTKTYGVTIQMKPLLQYFNIVLLTSQDFTKRNLEFFVNFLFLTSEGVKGLKVIE